MSEDQAPYGPPRFGVWQPIETAPRDGRSILAVNSSGARRVVWWGKHNHVPLYGWIFKCNDLNDDWEVDGFDACQWMPLPEPPISQPTR